MNERQKCLHPPAFRRYHQQVKLSVSLYFHLLQFTLVSTFLKCVVEDKIASFVQGNTAKLPFIYRKDQGTEKPLSEYLPKQQGTYFVCPPASKNFQRVVTMFDSNTFSLDYDPCLNCSYRIYSHPHMKFLSLELQLLLLLLLLLLLYHYYNYFGVTGIRTCKLFA